MAFVATTDASNGLISLALDGVAPEEVDIVRLDPDGVSTAVRNGEPAPTPSGEWDGLDYEAPLDTAVTYKALNVDTGAVLATSNTVTLASNGQIWLGHPGRPDLNIRPLVADFRPGTRAARSTTMQAIGRPRPIAQSLRRTSLAGTLILRTTSFVEIEQIHALIDDGQVLLLRGPATWGGYGTRYLSIGDVDFEPLTRVGTEHRYLVTMPFIEVDRPAGLSGAGVGYRWTDVVTTYASWADLAAAKADWDEVIAGV